MKVQHPQVQQNRRKTLTEFIKEGEVKLKRGKQYWLTDIWLSLLTTNYYFVMIIYLIRRYIYTRITKPMKMKYRLPVDLIVLLISLIADDMS
jgi:hypothetical protein